MRVLLIEPNYKNKYPPLGLMKLSRYHKMLNDQVVFFKGKPKDYFKWDRYNECLRKIELQDIEISDVSNYYILIEKYLIRKRKNTLKQIIEQTPIGYTHTIENILKHYAFHYNHKRKWDRIYVTTLFTFYWKETKEAIELAKSIVKSTDNLFVGGVAATVNPKIIEEETGLEMNKNILPGLLDKSGILDKNNIVIDKLFPDYSILETIEYKYPQNTGYLSFTTKGCTRKCKFCAVPILEPCFKEKLPIKAQIAHTKKKHGEKKDLILMDNNILASNKFFEIIDDIKSLGFKKGAKFKEPNKFIILLNYLEKENQRENSLKLKERISEYLIDFGNRRIRAKKENMAYFEFLYKHNFNDPLLIDTEILKKSKAILNKYINRYRNKYEKNRYVDFNQGVDCRYVDEEKMKALSEIAIRPLRLAFDHLSLKDKYINAVKLAEKYNIKDISNYLLFNHNDKPTELWERMKISMELDNSLDVDIFSFPMKYMPIFGKESLDRKYIGPYWNRKYLSAIQKILNVTKGIGMTGKDFFEKAFGKTPEEYIEILKLPEDYILYRNKYENNGKKNKWINQYKNLSKAEFEEANKIILSNDFYSFNGKTSKAVKAFIEEHYQK